MTYNDDVLRWAARYEGVGWPFLILPYGSKSPTKKKNWQDDRPTLADVKAIIDGGGHLNLGVLCGDAADGLVRIDPDCPEMHRACELGLPETTCMMTREGIDHPTGYFYRLTGPYTGPMTFKDPTGKGDEATLSDVIYTGRQSVLPPSLHPDGTHYGWWLDAFGPPHPITPDVLETRMLWINAGALMARHWPEGGRHDCMLAVAGGLLNAGWTTDDAEAWVRIVLHAACDDEMEDRIRVVYDTADRLALGKDAVGFTRLQDYMDKRVVKRVCDWLGITEGRKTTHIAQQDELRCTDEGNAQRLADLFGDRVRYVPEFKHWVFWDGARWVNEGRFSMLSYAIDTVKSIHAEAAAADTKDKRMTLAQWALDSESHRRITAAPAIAQGYTRLRASVRDFDTDIWTLNTPSGVLDLRTGKLADHDPSDLHMLITGAPYDPDAPRTRYLRFLDEIFAADAELIAFIQRAAGLCLTGSIREEVLFLCHGDGSNGKTKLLGAWRDALGDYAGTTPFDTFDGDANRGGIGNDLAALRGKRMVTASETDSERRLAEAKVKRVTGGDPVACRHLYGEFFEYVPTYKLWLAINHKPVIRGTDHGIWRRIILIPFNVQFSGEARDRDLELALREERAGVLAWMVEGLQKYLEVGLAPPDSVRAAVTEYKVEMNLLAEFIRENAEDAEEGVVPTRDLYLRYTYWTKDFGEKQLSHRAFSIQLKRLGYEPWASNGVRYWRGLTLKPEKFGPATVVANGAADGPSGPSAHQNGTFG